MTKNSSYLLLLLIGLMCTQCYCYLHLRSNQSSTQIATILNPQTIVNSTLDDCINKCQQNMTQIQCQNKCKTQNFNAQIFFFSGLGFFLAFFIIIFCCKRCDFQFDRQKKERSNQVNSNLMAKQQYDFHVHSFKLLLQNCRKGNSIFSYSDGFIGALPQNIKVLDFKLRDEQPFLTRFTVSARDAIGKWYGDGYLLAGENTIEIWFLKQYENYQGNFRLKHIIWQGKMISKNEEQNQSTKKAKSFENTQSPTLNKKSLDILNSYQGKWYYKDLQFRPQCSGTWKLEQINQNFIQEQVKK